jgi:hypothetical protein
VHIECTMDTAVVHTFTYKYAYSQSSIDSAHKKVDTRMVNTMLARASALSLAFSSASRKAHCLQSSFPARRTQDSREASLNEPADCRARRQVEDFNWLRTQQSPNWSILPEEQRAPPVIIPLISLLPSQYHSALTGPFQDLCS